ncbi:hypothetical protein AeNC1_018592, partial [Aphanomyces euteiches]
ADLTNLFNQYGHTAQDRNTIIDRIRKYYSPKVSAENQNKMKKFLAMLVRYFLKMASNFKHNHQDADNLAAHIFSMAQEMPNVADTQQIVTVRRGLGHSWILHVLACWASRFLHKQKHHAVVETQEKVAPASSFRTESCLSTPVSTQGQEDQPTPEDFGCMAPIRWCPRRTLAAWHQFGGVMQPKSSGVG